MMHVTDGRQTDLISAIFQLQNGTGFRMVPGIFMDIFTTGRTKTYEFMRARERAAECRLYDQ